MANYLFTYHGGGIPESEEEGAKVMEAWGKWMGELGSALVEQGNPVGESATLAADGSRSAGGNAASVTGYSIVAADSLDAALDLAKGCPIRDDGGSVEVGELVPM